MEYDPREQKQAVKVLTGRDQGIKTPLTFILSRQSFTDDSFHFAGRPRKKIHLKTPCGKPCAGKISMNTVFSNAPLENTSNGVIFTIPILNLAGGWSVRSECTHPTEYCPVQLVSDAFWKKYSYILDDEAFESYDLRLREPAHMNPGLDTDNMKFYHNDQLMSGMRPKARYIEFKDDLLLLPYHVLHRHRFEVLAVLSTIAALETLVKRAELNGNRMWSDKSEHISLGTWVYRTEPYHLWADGRPFFPDFSVLGFSEDKIETLVRLKRTIWDDFHDNRFDIIRMMEELDPLATTTNIRRPIFRRSILYTPGIKLNESRFFINRHLLSITTSDVLSFKPQRREHLWELAELIVKEMGSTGKISRMIDY